MEGWGKKEISSISNKVEQNGMAWNGLGNPQNDKLGINCEMEWDGMVWNKKISMERAGHVAKGG